MKRTLITGRRVENFSTRANPFIDAMMKTMKNDLNKSIRDRTERELKVIKRSIENAADREIKRITPFIANTLIGMRSPSTGSFELTPTFFGNDPLQVLRGPTKPGPRPFGSITWKPLSPNTLRSKSENKNRFFLHTGVLRQFFKQAAPGLLAAIGKTRVDVVMAKEQHIGEGKIIRKVAELKIRIAPSITSTLLPALATGRWTDVDPKMRLERKIGAGADIMRKLTGPTRAGYNYIHRPLLQPVVNFWLLHRVPTVISNEIAMFVGK